MCGRYQFSIRSDAAPMRRLRQLAQEAQLELPAGELAPGCLAPVLMAGGPKARLSLMQWGFPLADTGRLIFNARAESAGRKPLFAQCLARRRCVLPATAFYEWSHGEDAQQYRFTAPGRPVLYLAGLYDRFDGTDCFVILTCPAVGQVAAIHNRQPITLHQSELLLWLNDPQEAARLLQRPGEALSGEALQWEP